MPKKIFSKKKRYRRGAFLCVLLLLAQSVNVYAAPVSGTSSETAGVVSEQVNEVVPASVAELFDAAYYSLNNADVVEALGSDPQVLLQHFLQSGLKEGRSCSAKLNIARYRELYPDLAAMFGDDWDRYVFHYFTLGIKEGRSNGMPQPAANGSENRITYHEDGSISDDNGNILIPWDKFEEDKYLTLETLRERCGDSLILLQNEKGQVTFVGGNFSSVTVHDEKSAQESILCMMELIHFPEDTAVLVLNNIGLDSRGNTYYRFTAQINGEAATQDDYAVIVTTDKMGQTVSLSSADADRIAKQNITYDIYQEEWWKEWDDKHEAVGYIPLSETPVKIFSSYDNQYKWVKYYLDQGSNIVREVGIYANTKEGDDAWTTPTVNYYDYDNFKSGTYYSYDFVFKDKETEMKKFIDGYGNIVELPCAYEEGKGYYILDTARRIASVSMVLAEYNIESPGFLYFPEEYFDAIEDGAASAAEICEYLNNNNVVDSVASNYDNIAGLAGYIDSITTIAKSYDEFKVENLIPGERAILINFAEDLTNDNASCAYVSDCLFFEINNHPAGGMEFDGVAHEFGHGAVALIVGTFPYKHVTGALNESYADILGNLLEMQVKKQGEFAGEVDFDNWLIGEYLGGYEGSLTGGDGYTYDIFTEGVIRNMKEPECEIWYFTGDLDDPLRYISSGQPSSVNQDWYYISDPDYDYGGVHINSGILNNVCYNMYEVLFGDKEDQNGETYRELFDLWYDTLQYVTRDTSYLDEMYFMQQSMRNSGYSQEDIDKVSQLFLDANVEEKPINAVVVEKKDLMLIKEAAKTEASEIAVDVKETTLTEVVASDIVEGTEVAEDAGVKKETEVAEEAEHTEEAEVAGDTEDAEGTEDSAEMTGDAEDAVEADEAEITEGAGETDEARITEDAGETDEARITEDAGETDEAEEISDVEKETVNEDTSDKDEADKLAA